LELVILKAEIDNYSHYNIDFLYYFCEATTNDLLVSIRAVKHKNIRSFRNMRFRCVTSCDGIEG